jgi:hypothetical protein
MALMHEPCFRAWAFLRKKGGGEVPHSARKMADKTGRIDKSIGMGLLR